MSNVFAIATVTEAIVQVLSDTIDAAQVADRLHCLRVAACRRLEGETDQLFADTPRTVCLINDQGVNGDQVPRPLELASSSDCDQTDDVAITLCDKDLSRR